LNTSDEDAEKYIKVFTFLSREETEDIIARHKEAPHLRLLQKRLSEEITVMVHSREEYNMAVEASMILFGQGTADQLRKLNEKTFLTVFEGVPLFDISMSDLDKGISITELLTEKTAVFPSKGELRRTILANGLSLNKERITSAEMVVQADMLIGNKYLLAQKGKKNYFLIVAG
jgi:tyrosyl-tRNA synthetase